MLRGLFSRRRLKHERLEEEVEVRFRGKLVSERELGYTFVRPGGKSFCIRKSPAESLQLHSHKSQHCVCLREELTESSTLCT